MKNRGARRYGVRVERDDLVLARPRPVDLLLASQSGRGLSIAYRTAEEHEGGFVGRADVTLNGGARLRVIDVWTADDEVVRCSRTVRVEDASEDAFATSLRLQRPTPTTWADAVPFAPGAIYGDAEPVARRSIGGAPERRAGVRHLLIREDRLAAPLLGVRYPDGVTVAILHLHAGGVTTFADGTETEGGETLIDARFGVLSLGGSVVRGRLELGGWLPGSEGQITYTSGGLPLRQVQRWRCRYHPLSPSTEHSYELAFRIAMAESQLAFVRDAWKWAWRELAPSARPVSTAAVVHSGLEVLAGEVIVGGKVCGIPLEVDAVTRRQTSPPKAIMGFVGANTDAAALLVRVGRALPDDRGRHYRVLGEQLLDAFATLRLSPPEGEGFDLHSGEATTYRTVRGQPAVYLRSLAEGCAATVEAWTNEADHGDHHPTWLGWAQDGGDWLLNAQRLDGSFPRAWRAETGDVLDPSSSATYVTVPLLCALTQATGDARYLNAAVRAGEFVWANGGADGCFAGATLDNPDVVDKESAVLSLEAFLALHRATGDARWIERATVAADVAETWIYIWNLPMPADAAQETLHWKPGVPTTGQQLIATGVSMCDGFLAVNAAAFAALSDATGDPHYLEVARLVTHGTKAMYALPGRVFDLAGPGWQQEHWCLAIPRGRGLNRNWLPWVSVAHVKGILRLRDWHPAISNPVLLKQDGPG